jgi:hypothetical protein
MNKRIALVAVTVLGLAGCSSSTPAAKSAAPPNSATTTPVIPTTTEPPSPTVTAPPVDAPIALSKWFAGTNVKTRVIQVKQSVSSPYSDIKASQRWYAALVQTCVTSIPADNGGSNALSFSWGPWSVNDADGGHYEASSSTWEDFPKPEYPFGGETGFTVGECAKGWVMFSVLKSTKVTLIRYSNDSGDLGRWKV